MKLLKPVEAMHGHFGVEATTKCPCSWGNNWTKLL